MNEESRLQLERYLQLVNRRKWVLIVPVVLAVLGAALLSYLQDPVYVATATARVDTCKVVDCQDAGAADRFVNTYSHIIQTSPFSDQVVEDLGLQGASASLGGRVTTLPIAGTDLIEIQAKANDPDEAADIANKVTDLLQDPTFMARFLTDSTQILQQELEITAQTLEDEQAELDNLVANGASQSQINTQQTIVDISRASYETLETQLRQAAIDQREASDAFSVIEIAVPPDYPVSPRWMFNLAAGLMAGLAAGIALSLVLEYIDPTLRGVRDLESVTRLPVLASIPFGVRWKYPPPPVSPDYRLLATKLRTVMQEQSRKSVMFTSTRPEEGNTTVATYTAMAMAQAGLRVLLLDANLTQPDLHRLFNIPMSPGLYNFISQNGVRPTLPVDEAVEDVIQDSPVPRLSVLTAGTKMNDASELLASAEMRAFLDVVEAKWDVVLIDGSAMSGGAGAAVIAPIVDGVVLVAAEGQASSTSVEDTVGELASLGSHTLGLVYCKATEA